MLASIVPLVERARNRRWGLTASAYVVGSLVAGLALGAVSGLAGSIVSVLGVGSPSPRVLLAAAATACAIGAALDLGVGGVAVPTVRRQVNEDWLHRYRGWACGFGFGIQLGLGVITIVTSASVYLVFLLGFLSASSRFGAILGGAFGLARALPLLTMARVTTPGQLHARHRRLHRWAPAAARATVGAQCAAAAAAAAAFAVGGVGVARP